MEDFDALKAEIQKRRDSRLLECANSEGIEKISKAQGGFQELEALVGFIDLMENPPKEEESEKP